MIYPELIAAREIAMSLKKPWTRFWWELCNGTVILAAAKVRENAPIVNKYLYELMEANKRFHLVAIKRNNTTLIPRGNDQVLPNDIIYFTSLRKHIDNLSELLGKKSFETKKVMFMGGSRITMRTIQQLPQNISVKIIEKDRERQRCWWRWLHPTSLSLWRMAGTASFCCGRITETDAFLALTANSEANILGCMMAKQYGVKKTVAEVRTSITSQWRAF